MVTPIKIPDFQQTRAIVDKEGRPMSDFLRGINTAFRVLVNNANATNQALAAAGIAQAAAVAANAAAVTAQAAANSASTMADAVAQEASIVSSFPTGWIGNLIECNNAGVVDIVDHVRQYGNTTLNPNATINSAFGIATAASIGQKLRFYYDDATRTGGTVTYGFTVDPATPPVQGGNRHVVGSVTVPGSGIAVGIPVRPPGFTS
jgi:hypothetical protein